MNTIIYKRPIPTAKIIYGIGLIIIGIFSALDNVLGIPFCGVGLYFFHTKGIEIEVNKSKYRDTINFFGLTHGKWQKLPKIEYISVFKTTQTTRVWVSTASTNITETLIKVNLFYNNNRKIEIFNTKDVDDAFTKAKEIASILNVDILDATERESKWL